MDEIFEKYQKSSNLYCKQVDSDRVYIYNSYSKTGCYLNNKELFILDEMKGDKNYYDMIEQKVFALSEKGYIIFLEKLKKLNLLQDYEQKAHNSLIQYKLKLINPNDWISKYFNIIFPILSVLLICSIPMLVLGIARTDLSKLYVNLVNCISIKTGVAFYIVSFIFLAIHELSHALVAKSRGAEIVEIGLMIYVFIPFVYVTIASTRKLKNGSKMLIAISGILSNMFFVGILLVLLEHRASPILLFCLVSNFSQIVINANLFLEVDSYWFLESYLNLSGMYKKVINIFSFAKNLEYYSDDYDKLLVIIYGIFSHLNLLFLLILVLTLLFQTIISGGNFF